MKNLNSDIKQKIISFVRGKITTCGIHSISIDEICTNIGISKKTFYLQFATKQDMVALLLKDIEIEVEQKTHKWLEKNTFYKIMQDAVSIVKQQAHICSLHAFFHDIKKYYPQEYALHLKRMQESNINLCAYIITKGVESGFVKQDLNINAVAYILATINQHFMNIYCNDENLTKSKTLHKTIIQIILYGILTNTGEENLNKLLLSK